MRQIIVGNCTEKSSQLRCCAPVQGILCFLIINNLYEKNKSKNLFYIAYNKQFICCCYAIMPYILTLQKDVLEAAPIPLPLVILISILQSTILFAILIFFWLKLSDKLGFKTPILEKIISKEKANVDIKSIIKTSIILGFWVGIIIVLLDFLFTTSGTTISIFQKSVPIWQGFLASFYGWISEEIVMRLFFMTTILWIASKLLKNNNIIKNKTIVWSAIIIAALVFWVWHLPITASLTTVTPLVIFRALLLNGIWWLVFGWLYWKKGLESAIIAHFSTDIIIQVVLPFSLLLFS